MSRKYRRESEERQREDGHLNLNDLLYAVIENVPGIYRYDMRNEVYYHRQDILQIVEFLWKNSRNIEDLKAVFKDFDPSKLDWLAEGEAFNKETGEFEETE
jgi:hypothetical protein